MAPLCMPLMQREHHAIPSAMHSPTVSASPDPPKHVAKACGQPVLDWQTQAPNAAPSVNVFSPTYSRCFPEIMAQKTQCKPICVHQADCLLHHRALHHNLQQVGTRPGPIAATHLPNANLHQQGPSYMAPRPTSFPPSQRFVYGKGPIGWPRLVRCRTTLHWH